MCAQKEATALPAGTHRHAYHTQEVFGRCGPLARLVLPLTRTLALVEFQNAADARRAFASLAYRRFQSVPLYLEWAPAGVFATDAPVLARRSQQVTRDMRFETPHPLVMHVSLA